MKNYIKGIITGIIIGAVVCSIPAIADTIDALFNNVRISVNGVDQIQWGENIQLADGAETPASILYNGTTYLPMRKLGELSGNKIYWNGDSRTVGMTGAQKDIKIIAEKPDKNGNVWKYYTFKDSNDKNYLGVKDEARGYERVYHMACETFNVTDNEIYFLRQVKMPESIYNQIGIEMDLIKLPFDSDNNTQDGETIKAEAVRPVSGELIVGDWLFLSGNTQGTEQHGIIIAINYLSGERVVYYEDEHWTNIYNLHIIENDNEHMLIGYDLNDIGGALEREITFEKTTNTFVQE